MNSIVVVSDARVMNALIIRENKANFIPLWSAVHPNFAQYIVVASYPGRVGGERRLGIDCLRMRGRFRYIFVKL